MKSFVSVVMSVFNGSQFMRESIESILGQTYADFQFVIVDDGSDDDSWDILTEYAIQDDRLLLVRNQSNMGLTRSLNKALRISRGKYIARQDADDLSLPERLEKQVRFMEAHPHVVLASSNHDRIDQEGRFVRRMKLDCHFEMIVWNLLFSNYLGGHSQVMFRRDQVMDLGGYSETCHYAQDYELWIRLLEHGQIVILPDILLKYRLHDARLSNTASRDQLLCVLEASRKHISRYLPEALTLSEVAALWGFWTLRNPPDFDFDKPDRHVSVHNRLRLIYNRFLAARSKQGAMTFDLTRSIRLLIAERYLQWAFIEAKYRHRIARAGKALCRAIQWTGFRLIQVIVKLARRWVVNLWLQKRLR